MGAGILLTAELDQQNNDDDDDDDDDDDKYIFLKRLSRSVLSTLQK